MTGSAGFAGVSGRTGRGVSGAGFGTSATGGFTVGVRVCWVVLQEMRAKLTSGGIAAICHIRRLNRVIPTSGHLCVLRPGPWKGRRFPAQLFGYSAESD